MPLLAVELWGSTLVWGLVVVWWSQHLWHKPGARVRSLQLCTSFGKTIYPAKRSQTESFLSVCAGASWAAAILSVLVPALARLMTQRHAVLFDPLGRTVFWWKQWALSGSYPLLHGMLPGALWRGRRVWWRLTLLLGGRHKRLSLLMSTLQELCWSGGRDTCKNSEDGISLIRGTLHPPLHLPSPPSSLPPFIRPFSI